jgi:glucokinase
VTADLTIGVDVGGTKCLGVVVGADGAVTAEHRVPTPKGSDEVVDAIVATIVELQRGAPEAMRACVGAPGLIDREGVLRFAPNLGAAAEVPVRAELEQRLPGTAVVVENDANCAAWGEWVAGAALGADDVVMVTLGTGIGGGIILGGALFRGAHGFAGEIGHVVVDPHGPICPCGQRGCWERYASGSGLGWLGREAAVAGQAARVVELAGGDPEAVRGEHVTRAAAEGDAQALAVMDRFAWWVALGLANLANTFDPSRFVLGGGLVEAGALLLDPVSRHFLELVEAATHRPAIDIVAATLGERAGAIGAADLARLSSP